MSALRDAEEEPSEDPFAEPDVMKPTQQNTNELVMSITEPPFSIISVRKIVESAEMTISLKSEEKEESI